VTCYLREVFYLLRHSDFPFASVTGDIAKAQGDGKAFSLLPANAKISTGDRSGWAKLDDPIPRRTSSAASGFGRNLRLFSGLFTIPAQKFVIALIDSFRSHP
jgi:hypothetical protein